MQKIHIKNKDLQCNLYIDEWHDDMDKLRLYDSKKEYLCYFEPDWIRDRAGTNGVSPEDYVKHLKITIAESKDLMTLMEDILRFDNYAIDKDIDSVIEKAIYYYCRGEEIQATFQEVSLLTTYEEKLKWLDDCCEGINTLGDFILAVFEE